MIGGSPLGTVVLAGPQATTTTSPAVTIKQLATLGVG